MVCPNCHSKRIIQVQDQFFCINCGQMIPNPASNGTGKVAVQANGLPEGVTILSPAGDTTPDAPQGQAQPEVTVASEPATQPEAQPAAATATIIKPRHRMQLKTDDAEQADGSQPEPAAGETKPPESAPEPSTDEPAAKAKPAPKRKRGRPKAGRLDVPAVLPAPAAKEAPIAVAAEDAATSTEAAAVADAAVAPPAPSIRRMSDISPRPAAVNHPSTSRTKRHATKPANQKPKRIAHTVKHKPKPIHKLGIAPLHYGSVLGNTLRAHTHKNYLIWGLVAVGGFALAMAYCAWLYFTMGPKDLARHLVNPGLLPLLELATLVLLYYIGRSIGQTAIMYGVIRHADERPVSLSRQFGVAVNSFGRRFRLDAACAILNTGIVAIISLLVVTGGAANWPISGQWQFVALFCAFLFLLYVMAALAMARGLANVALTTTTETVWKSIKLGWKLFSHRFELLGFRFIALAMELLLCVPLAAVALLIIVMAPPAAHLLAIVGVALIAVVAGTLVGVGTAAWWASLYRRIVLTDRQPEAVQLLASRQPNDARRGSLAVIVMAATLLICLAAALPWLKFV